MGQEDGQPATAKPTTDGDRATRTARMFVASMRVGGVTHSITVRNISQQGIGARMQAAPPPVGTEVTVELAGVGSLPGRVRWVDGNRFGVQLAAPIDPGAFTFSAKNWESARAKLDGAQTVVPFEHVVDTRRPGFRVR